MKMFDVDIIKNGKVKVSMLIIAFDSLHAAVTLNKTMNLQYRKTGKKIFKTGYGKVIITERGK